MPQHYPGRGRLGRRAAFLPASALAGGLILSSGLAAPAASASIDQASAQPAGSARQTYTAGIYFVQLQDKPIATYSRTAPAPGERLNTRTKAVRDYIGQLKRERDKPPRSTATPLTPIAAPAPRPAT